MAEELGKRLLAEVEEVGLDEVGHMTLPRSDENISELTCISSYCTRFDFETTRDQPASASPL